MSLTAPRSVKNLLRNGESRSYWQKAGCRLLETIGEVELEAELGIWVVENRAAKNSAAKNQTAKN